MVGKDRKTVPVLRPSGERKRLFLQLLMGLIIFLSGAIAGTGGTLHWFKIKGGRFPSRSMGSKRPTAQKLVEDWTAKYGLSSEQATEIERVLEESMQKRHAMFTSMRETMDAADVVFVESMRTILTDEQFVDWLEMYQKRRQSHRRPEGGRSRGPRGMRGGHRGDPNRMPPSAPNDV